MAKKERNTCSTPWYSHALTLPWQTSAMVLGIFDGHEANSVAVEVPSQHVAWRRPSSWRRPSWCQVSSGSVGTSGMTFSQASGKVLRGVSDFWMGMKESDFLWLFWNKIKRSQKMKISGSLKKETGRRSKRNRVAMSISGWGWWHILSFCGCDESFRVVVHISSSSLGKFARRDTTPKVCSGFASTFFYWFYTPNSVWISGVLHICHPRTPFLLHSDSASSSDYGRYGSPFGMTKPPYCYFSKLLVCVLMVHEVSFGDSVIS